MMQGASFLLAGFIFLAADLIQFVYQKKLKDRYSLMFTFILVTGLIMCVLSELSIEPAGFVPFSQRVQFLTASAGCYICILLISYEMLRYGRYRLSSIWAADRKWEQHLHRILLMIGIAAVVANVHGHFIYDIDPDGSTKETALYMPFMGFITCICILNACCIVNKCRRSIDHRVISILIAYSVMILGIIISAFGSDMMFMCFGVVVSTNIIYLKLSNPLTYLDTNTDCFNMTYFRQIFVERQRKAVPQYLLVIELYQMERITRVYEKGIEEKLISKIADRLKASDSIKNIFHTRPERFVVEADSEEALDAMAKCIRKMFRGSMNVDGRSIRCAASLVELVDLRDIESIEALTLYARFLLKQAEKSGKTQIVKDTTENREMFYAEQEIERVMEDAIRNDRMETVYQPVYSLKEKRFVSMETLSRLRHPVTGQWMSPEVFIHLAEESGHIMEITKLQLRKVCWFIRENEDVMEYLDDIKINISAVELGDPDHCDELISIIKSCGVDTGRLRFEITETAVIHNKAEVELSFTKFRQAGISLCIDDFGSGYADFSNLVELPVTGVKLDRSLLTGICSSDFAATFYRNVVRTLSELGFDVIAEGVEKEEEVELLGRWGVDKIQGYYYARPARAGEIREIVIPAGQS